MGLACKTNSFHERSRGMIGATLLLRQVHPSFVQNGRVTSQAFRPTPKDESKLSVFDGDRTSPEASWLLYTASWGLASIGTLAVTVDECGEAVLPIQPDPLPDCPEHCLIDFSGFTNNECVKKSKKLQAQAEARGWLFQTTSGI